MRSSIEDPISDFSLSETTREFGLAGELIKVIQDSGSATPIVSADYSYDVGGNLSISSLFSGAITQDRSFDYDGLGFLREVSVPEKTNTVFHSGYDALGNIGRTIEGSRDLTYAYDVFGRISTIKEFGGATDLKTFEYYPITVNPPPAGTWGWGKLGRTTRRNPVGAGEFTVEHSYSYYGKSGAVSHLKTVTGLNGNNGTFNQSYEWDDLGALSKVTYPDLVGSTTDPSLEINYTHNRGWLTGVKEKVGGGALVDLATNFSYHPNGVLAGLNHSNGVTESYGIDPDYMARPQSIAVNVHRPYNDWASGVFSYDGAGNIIGIGDKSFAYDHANRLAEFLDGPGGTFKTCGFRASFSYDGFGNIVDHAYPEFFPTNQTCPPLTTMCRACFTLADPANNQFEDYAYDSFGNQTQFEFMGATDQFQYTVFDELYLLNVGDGPFIYGFDVDGERFGVSDPNLGGPGVWGIRYTIRDIGGRVLREFNLQDTESSTWSWEKDYIWAGSRLIAIEDENGRQHIHPDHLGSTRLVTDSSGNRVSYHEYYPLGMEITPPYQDDVRMKFTGHERDSLADQNSFYDLDYMHARNYSLLFGRFTSLDPAPANPANPQTWHPYAYVLNNPIRYRDPWGLSGDDTSNHGTSGCFAGSAAGDQACLEQNPMTYRDMLPMIAAIAPGKPHPIVENGSLEGNVSFSLGGFGKSLSESLGNPVPVLIDISLSASKNKGVKLDVGISPGGGFSASLLAVYSTSFGDSPSQAASVFPVGASFRGGLVFGGGFDISSDLGNLASGNFYADVDFKLGLATKGSGRFYSGDAGFNGQALWSASWRPWPLWY